MDKTSAKLICDKANSVFDLINDILQDVNNQVEKEERAKFQLALGTVIAELDVGVLEPIYKQYPEFRPEGMESI
jgi:hypothetical protein